MSGASIRLPADPASVASARRFVESTLREWGHQELVEAARLCVSELVTNVVIHARSAVELAMSVSDGVFRVDIDDTSSQLPLPKRYAVDAATGRGLHLVEFLASAWGADPIPSGKRVWFELSLHPGSPANGDDAVPGDGLDAMAQVDMVAARFDARHDFGAGPVDESVLIDVHILDLPVRLYQETAAHQDELQREFALIHASDSSSVPARVLALAAEMSAQFGPFTREQQARLAAAVAAGEPTIDLHYRVPPTGAIAAQRFEDLLDEADEFCRRERLITLETAPSGRAFRRWFFGQFVDQIGGAQPAPWTGSYEEGPSGWLRDSEAWAQSLQAEETAVMVVDNAGRVRRWSRSAAAVYGITPGDARGRSLTSLVGDPADAPPLRDAIGNIVGGRTGLVRRRMRDRDGSVLDVVGFAVRVVDEGEPALAMLGVPAGGALGPEDQPSPSTWRRLQLLAAERVARLEGEEAIDVLAAVHLTSIVLSDAKDLADVAKEATREAVAVTGGSVASLYIVADDRVNLCGTFGHNDEWVQRWGSVARDANLPINVALDQGHAIWVASPEERDTRFANVAVPITSSAFAVLPLRSEGRMIGALGIAYEQPRSFPPTDRRLLEALADVCAHAVTRALALAETESTVASLEALLRTAPLGIAFFDADLRFVRVNEQLARITGLEVADHIGRAAAEVTLHPDQVVPLLERVLHDNTPILGTEWTGTTRGVPTPRTYQMDLYPVGDDSGQSTGVGVVLRDISDERALTGRLQGLQDLTSALARAVRRDEIASTVLERGGGEIGATSGSLCLLTSDGESLELIADVGYTVEAREAWKVFPLSADTPAAAVIRSGEPMYLPSPPERDERFPILRTRPTVANRASAVLPLIAERGAPFGALTISFDAPRDFDESDRSFLVALASQCSIGLERVALSERVETALQSAERDRALLATLLEQAPVGLAFFDLDGRYLQVNETMAKLNGLPAEQFVGRAVGEVLTALAPDAQRDLRAVVETGEPIIGHELSGPTPASDDERHWLVSWYPVRDEIDHLFAVGCLVLDITDRKRAERDLERLLTTEKAARAAAESATVWVDRLQELADDESTSEELSADDQLDETLGGLLTALRDLFGGDAAALLLADAAGSELVTRAAIGFGPRVEAVHIAVGAGFAGSVMAGQRPVVVDDISGYEIVSPALRDSGLRSLMAVPLVTADRTLGVMHVGSRKLAHFAAEDAEDLLLIADRIAAALERSRLLSAERAARAAAESAHERLAFLSDATRVASSSLDRRQILDRVARLAVPRLADWCTVYVKVDDRIVRVALHTTDTSRTEIRHVRDTLDHALDGSSVVERIWETGAAVLVDDPAREARSTVGTRLEQLVDELGVASYMIVPVVTRGRTEAVMSFGVGTGRSRYSRDDLALAQELAGRVATGLANAALYEREHSVAESLTRAVLPERMPELPGLTVSARYRPAGANVDVGGDWYDAFALGDGRVGLVIGDVGGHGLPAASGMVQLRNGLRSYAILGLSPSEVLARTAEFMTASDLVAETIATVLYAVYDPVTGVLTWSSAGHPPPLFITHGQAKFLDTLPGPLLGVGAPAEYPEQNTQLEPGSGLILYTDGLVEQRDENIDIGFERLANAAKLLETIEPNSACAALIDELTGQADRDDDCCIMCVHRSP